MKKKMILVLMMVLVGALLFAEGKAVTSTVLISSIFAAAAVGIACLGGGLAVGKLVQLQWVQWQKMRSLGKALPFVGLAEGICLWGFLVALLIIVM